MNHTDTLLHAVIVADTKIDAQGEADPEVIGPFDTQDAAEEWAMREMRYVVLIVPLTMRDPS